MMLLNLLTYLAIIYINLDFIKGFPEGPPKEACNDMKFQHLDILNSLEKGTFEVKIEQLTQSSFNISLIGRDDFERDNLIQNWLGSIGFDDLVDMVSKYYVNKFRGFMIQMRENSSEPSSSRNLGSFHDFDSEDVSTMDCRYPRDTITHNNNFRKSSISATWYPDNMFSGKVYAIATVVESYEAGGVGFTSDTISVANEPPDNYMELIYAVWNSRSTTPSFKREPTTLSRAMNKGDDSTTSTDKPSEPVFQMFLFSFTTSTTTTELAETTRKSTKNVNNNGEYSATCSRLMLLLVQIVCYLQLE